MSLFAVVQRILNKAGNAFIEPRREDGHGSAADNASFTQLADDTGTAVEWISTIPAVETAGLPVRIAGGTGRPCGNNTSTTPLNAGQTYTGTGELNNHADVFCTVYTDQDATLYLEFSPDGTNWDSSVPVYVNAGLQERHVFVKGPRYFRVRLTNTSASNQTYLRLHCYYGSFRQLTSTLNSTVREDADSTIVRSIDSETDIAASRFQGFSIVNKFGTNSVVSSGTVPEAIWEGGGTYTGFPATAETLRASSTSNSDTNGGVGAERVQIQAMTLDWELVTVTFTLSGTTPVAPDSPYTSTKFLRAHTATVIQSANGANTASNVGIITINHSSTTANVFLTIQAGRNQSNCSAYSVPAGYTAYMRFLHVAIRGTAQLTQSQAVEGHIYTRAFGRPFRGRRPFIVTSNYRLEDKIYGGLVFTEKSDIVLRITAASANDISVNGGYDLLLVKNLEV